MGGRAALAVVRAVLLRLGSGMSLAMEDYPPDVQVRIAADLVAIQRTLEILDRAGETGDFAEYLNLLQESRN